MPIDKDNPQLIPSDFLPESKAAREKEHVDLKERTTLFAKTLLYILKISQFEQPPGKFLSIADIGCSFGEEIPALFTEFSAVFDAADIRMVAIDPDEDIKAAELLVGFLLKDEDRDKVMIFQDFAEKQEYYNCVKKEPNDPMSVILMRNPNIHRPELWKKTMELASTEIGESGRLVITCENDHELRNNIKLLSDLNLSIKVYEIQHGNLTHSSRDEKYWIVANKVQSQNLSE